MPTLQSIREKDFRTYVIAQSDYGALPVPTSADYLPPSSPIDFNQELNTVTSEEPNESGLENPPLTASAQRTEITFAQELRFLGGGGLGVDKPQLLNAYYGDPSAPTDANKSAIAFAGFTPSPSAGDPTVLTGVAAHAVVAGEWVLLAGTLPAVLTAQPVLVLAVDSGAETVTVEVDTNGLASASGTMDLYSRQWRRVIDDAPNPVAILAVERKGSLVRLALDCTASSPKFVLEKDQIFKIEHQLTSPRLHTFTIAPLKTAVTTGVLWWEIDEAYPVAECYIKGAALAPAVNGGALNNIPVVQELDTVLNRIRVDACDISAGQIDAGTPVLWHAPDPQRAGNALTIGSGRVYLPAPNAPLGSASGGRTAAAARFLLNSITTTPAAELIMPFDDGLQDDIYSEGEVRADTLQLSAELDWTVRREKAGWMEGAKRPNGQQFGLYVQAGRAAGHRVSYWWPQGTLHGVKSKNEAAYKLTGTYTGQQSDTAPARDHGVFTIF